MKGDFSRLTFRPEKHFSSVRAQQGRVQLDSDWNEATDIINHAFRNAALDVIGTGSPLGSAAFTLLATTAKLGQSTEFLIDKGRYYVAGITCENYNPVPFTAQPDLPGLRADANAITFDEVLKSKTLVAFDLPRTAGRYLAYLDVWQRHISRAEDPSIVEPALGGPDTTTRTKTIWQLKLLSVRADASCVDGDKRLEKAVFTSTCKLKAQSVPQTQPSSVCVVPTAGGYTRLENQLYRVEIQNATAGSVTFKWSRENGSVVARWTAQAGNKIDFTVESIGRDQVRVFSPDDWVELIDDTRELWGLPGTLVQLDKAEGQILTIRPATADGETDFAAFPLNPRIRRWDQKDTDTVKLKNGALAVTEGSWQTLEGGVQVCFDAGGTYHTGDYWTIPARTAIGDQQHGDVDWPRDKNGPLVRSPQGITHHYCPIALLDYDTAKKKFSLPPVSDCRTFFAPVTQDTNLLYVSGDGQEGVAGDVVSLQARVVNGAVPVVGARVSFSADDGSFQTGNPAVTTRPDGIAEVKWQLGNKLTRQATARLLDNSGQDVAGQVIHFNVNTQVASHVVYQSGACTELTNARNVQDAINKLCKLAHGACCTVVSPDMDLDTVLKESLGKNGRDVCLCLAPGIHHTAFSLTDHHKAHLTICACSRGTQLVLEEPLQLRNFLSVVLRGLHITVRSNVEKNRAGIMLDGCREVVVDDCRLVGLTEGFALLGIGGAAMARVLRNDFQAYARDAFRVIAAFMEKTQNEVLATLFRDPDPVEVQQAASRAAEAFEGLKAEERNKLSETITRTAATDRAFQKDASPMLLQTVKDFSLLLATGAQASDCLAAIYDIRNAAVKTSRSGIALVLADASGDATMDANSFNGITSIYGFPEATRLNDVVYRNLQKLLAGNGIAFSDTNRTLRFTDNDFGRVFLGGRVVKNLQKMTTDKGEIGDIFNLLLVTGNRFTPSSFELLATRVNMEGNYFESPEAADFDLGISISNTGVYTGNHCPNPETRVFAPAFRKLGAGSTLNFLYVV